MKLLAILMFVVSCGQTEFKDSRTKNPRTSDMYKVIGTAYINAEMDTNYSAINATSTSTVTHTVAQAQNFTIDVGSLTPVEVNDDLLDLGSITADAIKVNNLEQCGINSDQKCTSAIIRIYTTEVSGHSGVSGFVNKDDSYGIDVKVGEVTATSIIGLTQSNAITVDSYTIPANDKKLTSSDFNGVTYELEVDFSNAGAGDYEMNLVVELAVAL